MDDIATDSDGSPGAGRIALPLWYSILVCVGSAGVGGFFGVAHEVVGILFGAAGGLGVAVLWLSRVSKLQTRSAGLRFIGGIGWGVIAGVIDTFWLHLTAWGLGYHTFGVGECSATLEEVLFVGSTIGAIAGATYGLLCIFVLEVHRGYMQRERA